ncbi:hypothetical protein LINPERPRIM_LOCUS31442 [Linum perenne]
MSDGWTNTKRRSICNFLVNSPKGTVFVESLDTSNFSKNASKVFEMLDNVVEKVGEENVIQIVTDNAAAYKAAETKLMEKRKHLFWTPCASHCFDLMLEDFDKNLKVHKSTIEKGRKITNFIYASTILISMLREFIKGHDLVRPGATRFATTYLTLACLSEHKGALMTMYSSDAWKKGSFSNIPKGKNVQGIVLDGRFESNVSLCIRAALPLVKVLRLVDSEEYPSMPFLYFELLQGKEKIKLNFNNNEPRYKPILDIIDKRWENQMQRPLHYVAYWLNPRVHFSQGFQNSNKKQKLALYETVDRLIWDKEEKLIVMSQLDSIPFCKRYVFSSGAMELIGRKQPADWWSSFGDDVPELQKFTIRVLSLTTSASGCERNWSIFEMVHSKRRNTVMQQKMNDLVYVNFNSRLISNQLKKKEREFDEIDFDDEWIAGDDEGTENEIVVELSEDGDVDGSHNDHNIPAFEHIVEQVSIIV